MTTASNDQTLGCPVCGGSLGGFPSQIGAGGFSAALRHAHPTGLLNPLCLGNARRPAGVDISQSLANVVCRSALDPAGEAVGPSVRIDDHKASPVTACKNPPALFKGIDECP